MGMSRSSSTGYKVVINHEEQYSIVSVDETLQRGWRDTGTIGSKDSCLKYIEEVWTDMKTADRQRILDNLK